MTAGGAIGGMLGCVLQIAFVALGLAQIFAAIDQMTSLWDIDSWVAVVACVALMIFFPIALPFFSFFGAMDVWGWEWWQALLLSAPFLIISGIITLTGGVGAMMRQKRRG